ncbi:hypothetical protein [Kordiimonas marina]|uniref:hypothetical protein n=1 Tax=Kordiimonas marina TaxID=2872312 RepID=UPI001FF1B40C|nr:hypothetical protein [Kordiimonas marina]MCJ9430116.1 hypothetical protein [Kordiimonas marina]
MTLNKFRKDNNIWDIAIVAILLNAFLQISCCIGPAAAGDFGLSDPANWCSIDKAAAAQDATGSGHSHNHDCCKDCRQCMGQAVALTPEATPAALAVRVAYSFTPVYKEAALTGLHISPYGGRGPPLTLQA